MSLILSIKTWETDDKPCKARGRSFSDKPKLGNPMRPVTSGSLDLLDLQITFPNLSLSHGMAVTSSPCFSMFTHSIMLPPYNAPKPHHFHHFMRIHHLPSGELT